jgi:hypothetical protein
MIKSIFRGLTEKGNSQSGSLAKVYLVNQDKVGRNREKGAPADTQRVGRERLKIRPYWIYLCLLS